MNALGISEPRGHPRAWPSGSTRKRSLIVAARKRYGRDYWSVQSPH